MPLATLNLIQSSGLGATAVDYHGYDYNANGWITAARAGLNGRQRQQLRL